MKKNRFPNNAKKTAALLACLFVFICASCAQSSPEKTVKEFFRALNALEFTEAGVLLGDENAYSEVRDALADDYGSYLEEAMEKGFIAFIYENLECEILSSEETDNGCKVSVKISAYDAGEVVAFQNRMIEGFKASDEYADMNEAEKYVSLCEFIPLIYKNAPKNLTKTVTNVTIKLKKTQGGAYTIVPEKTLFDAMTGGAK